MIKYREFIANWFHIFPSSIILNQILKEHKLLRRTIVYLTQIELSGIHETLFMVKNSY